MLRAMLKLELSRSSDREERWERELQRLRDERRELAKCLVSVIEETRT